MKFFIPIPLHKRWFPENVEGIEFVRNPKLADIVIKMGSWDDDAECLNKESRTIYMMPYIHGNATGKYTRKNMRNGFCVDDKIGLPKVKNFCFSGNDLCEDSRIITIPVGFNNEASVSQEPLYWQKVPKIENFKHTGKLYWKGNGRNHATRRLILDFFGGLPNFDVSIFEYSIYKEPCPSEVYKTYTNCLSNSDMSFCMRGDRPSTHSFFDLLQYGCIPIGINCMDIGWENIINNPTDYFLNFALPEDSLEYIHSKILELLSDENKILKMKQNCVNLFELFFKSQSKTAWGEFILAKCIEIFKKDFDPNRIDNTFVSSELLSLKGLNEKI